MSWHRIYTVCKKDIRSSCKQKGLVISVIITFVILGILLPIVMDIAGGYAASRMGKLEVPVRIPGVSGQYAPLYIVSTYLLTPAVILLPAYLGPMLAGSSFVGERIAQTAEGLIYTPLTKNELVIGKMGACIVPCLAVSWVTMIFNAVIIDCFSLSRFHVLMFPNGMSWITGLLLVPLASFLMTEAVMLVSQHVKTEKASRAVSILVSVPLIVLLESQYSAVLLSNKLWLAVIVLIYAGIDVILFLFLTQNFNKTSFLLKD